jgi:hypothetical protein
MGGIGHPMATIKLVSVVAKADIDGVDIKFARAR